MASTRDIRSVLKGVADPRYDGKVTQYRGIQYATIKKRFAKPVLNSQWQKATNYTKFGPQCPQDPIDFRELLQIPKDLENWPPEGSDELKCDNLTISCPSDPSLQDLPVILWIYGGGQMNAFGSAAQRVGDTNPIVAQSIDTGKPVVFVSINHRLNVFAFGDREGELNLDLQDQRTAIEWVKNNIGQFGGNAENITLAGESAGSVYIHALLASGTHVSKAIMHSGSLFSTPMQPDKRGLGLLGLIEGNLQLIEVEKGNTNPGGSVAATISGAPADRIVQTIRDLQIKRKWIWQEKSLDDWRQLDKAFGKLKGFMIGDCEAEWALYWFMTKKLKGSEILKALQSASAGGSKRIAEAYTISASEDAISQVGAAKFVGDLKFNWASVEITRKLREAGIDVHRFLFDQINPFAKTHASAYHTVDLLAIFGGYDDVAGHEMREVGRKMRSNWIAFAYGDSPWDPSKVYAYGPGGKTGEITDEEAASRRRAKQFQVLEEVGFDTCHEMYQALLSAGEMASSS